MAEPHGVIMQYFHWYTPADGSLWKEFADCAHDLAAVGITAVWLPPAYKGSSGGFDTGYGVYDLYDLGEFDQKGSIRTKYGTKSEYLNAIQAAKTVGINVYADVILNHMVGGDATEEVEATPLSWENQKDAIGETRTIKAWTQFAFPGRQGQYSTMEWHWWHFDAVDYDANREDENAIYVFKGKFLQDDGDLEDRATAFLIGCDLDTQSEEVRAALKQWGDWYVETTQVDGFRFDAVKHVRSDFFSDFLRHCRDETGQHLFAMGEYWSGDVNLLQKFIDRTGGHIHLFDIPLHYNLSRASRSGDRYDLTTIFDQTLVQQQPELAVTMVDNHDSQPLQASESTIEPWFKPHAYALILLRQAGYPCIFYADYYGAHYTDVDREGRERDIRLDSYRWLIDRFLHVRYTYAFGEQHDYFDHPNTIGWTRLGDSEHPGGMAVVMTNGDKSCKYMKVGPGNRTYYDITEQSEVLVTTDREGWGEFCCVEGSVSVWIPRH
ncbi:alpha-amylase [filamentous cyanobacterium CCT1]|nr:alpha-amylase [filamentous cyanobacterium CCT1]PSN81197.1 alpha-amylase [filamentous cyanobacterium CCP4]